MGKPAIPDKPKGGADSGRTNAILPGTAKDAAGDAEATKRASFLGNAGWRDGSADAGNCSTSYSTTSTTFYKRRFFVQSASRRD